MRAFGASKELAMEKEKDNPNDNSKEKAKDRIARYAVLNGIPPRIVQPMPHHHLHHNFIGQVPKTTMDTVKANGETDEKATAKAKAKARVKVKAKAKESFKDEHIMITGTTISEQSQKKKTRCVDTTSVFTPVV